MTSTELTGALWRKSSHSNGQANCVEVATVQIRRAAVAIRDSKSADGRCLIFTTRAWQQLVNSVRTTAEIASPL
jgi:Domain of unknown function (DUF397)